MSKKRILHIAEASGGVERYLVALLSKMKHHTEFEHILVCSDSLDKNKFKGLVEAVAVVEEMYNPISVFHDFKAVIAVRMAIKHYNPDIVYCHSSKAGAIGRVANLGIKNKLIYNAHGWSFNMKGVSEKKIKLYENVEKMLAPMANKIVCISEYEKKSAIDHGICGEDKLIVINNGINFDEYKNFHPKSREELRIPDDAFVVGTVGRLAKQKAPDVFVKMANDVKGRIPEAFFLMIGDGLERAATEETIKAIGLEDSFLITGWVNNPLDYLSVFDEAVLLSRWEGFGLVLPEYMIMEKPIIATKVDAIPYLIENAGILVDVDDYKQAAESVVKLKDDKGYRNQLIGKGKDRVKLFDVQRTAEEHCEMFKAVIGEEKTFR